MCRAFYMNDVKFKRFIIYAAILMLSFMFCFYLKFKGNTDRVVNADTEETTTESNNEKEYIKWVDFNVTYNALCTAYTYDVDSYKEEVKINWIELLAYTAAKNWGDFSNENKIKTTMAQMVETLNKKEKTIEELTGDLKQYQYFHECYEAILGGLVGEYELDGELKYGLKGYSPIAKNFYYNDFDDFGVSRSYGYKRRHLGHDMMGQTGTPIVAVESGIVEAMGWNQYGGWRLGIRSFDGKRYYYYAHLRKDFPYCKTLEEGSIVTAGDVIGYLGRTGYSAKENVNNIDESHLHFGIQLIFDESQKEGVNEIWIDPYNIIRFLYRNKSETQKNQDTKEWVRMNLMTDPMVVEYKDKMGIE